MISPIVTLTDMRSLGYCTRGARAWFQRHGIDWRQFRHTGLPSHVLEATGDAMAIKLCKWVRDGR